MAIRLNFVNRSDDQQDVVLFQKNIAGLDEGLPVAWRVIRHCGRGFNHPFSFTPVLAVCAGDCYGNYTPRLPAAPGELFRMETTPAGEAFVPAGAASDPEQLQVVNTMPQGAIDALVFRDDRLLALRTGVAPMQKAVFRLRPSLWVGVVQQIGEGDLMSPAVVAGITTELSLQGVVSADIVMSGGAPTLLFSLDNVVTG